MIEFASLAIVGAAVSAIVQAIKVNSFVPPVLAVVLLSVAGGAGYFFLRDSNALKDMLQVLLYANTVYLFLIKPFES